MKTMTVKLGWNSSDQLSGALRELSEKLPDNKPLKELYELVSAGLCDPITITFDDDNED
jgi:hypothetical protein